jgi:HK97 family phage prohead protease
MDRLTVPVEWKALDGAAPDADTGELTGYISAFGTIDLGGDVVLPGAFRKTFQSWNSAKAKMPLLTDHDMTESGVIGVVTSMHEDAYGARITARFSSDEKAQQVRRKMVDLGGSGMSFTYLVVRSTDGVQDGRPVRFLHEVKAVEATVTWVPMNAHAYATAKSIIALPDADPSEAGQAADLAQLQDLEHWGAAEQDRLTVASLAGMTADDHLHIGAVMQAADTDRLAADLEAWAATVAMPDPQRDEAERRAAAWHRENAHSAATRRATAYAQTHGCGNCWYCHQGDPAHCQLVRR